jgi:hypothetical protein
MDVEFVPEATKRVQKDVVAGDTPDEAAEPSVQLAGKHFTSPKERHGFYLSTDLRTQQQFHFMACVIQAQ